MKWMIDDGPFGLLARHVNASWAWPAATMELVQSVAASAPSDRSGRRKRLLSMDRHGEPCLRVNAVEAGSPGFEVLFNYLRQNADDATRDFGEDESIAYCMTEGLDLVFVTIDKQAAFTALAELGPARVATAFDLWAWLGERGLISKQEEEALHAVTLKNDTRLPGVPRRLLASNGPVVSY